MNRLKENHMLYSELVNSEFFKKAMEKAKVSEIPSPLLKAGDFPSGYPDDLFTNPKWHYLVDSLHGITDREVLARCHQAQHDQFVAEHEERMKPHKEREAKEKFIKPIVEKYVGGRFKDAFKQEENAFVNVITAAVVDAHEFQIHPEKGFQTHDQDYDNSMSELENVLKQASVLRLNDEPSPEEFVLKTIDRNGYANLLNL